MGVVYIKVAQILAMQNIGNLFTESDRQKLAQVCDHCNPIKFSTIQQILKQEYGQSYLDNFQTIAEAPLGSASISQVHRAVLKDGTEVVLKIKRCDVARRVEKDIRQLRRLIHRFGKLAKFRNFFGSDRALEYYMEWIIQETNFTNERDNLLQYQAFANSVNGKIKDVKTNIVVPKLFPKFCTDNIIVMEYIKYPTISQLSLTAENQKRIAQAENDYIKLSFYALFHDMSVMFHGDPHGGNLYLDDENNLGFLDLGLVFAFTPEEARMTRQLFLNSYTGKAEGITDILCKNSEFEQIDRTQLTEDMRCKIKTLHQMPVPQFFVEMMMIFTQHDIAPPAFLFKMAKAFLALYGLGTITNNYIDTEALLSQQVAEFYMSRTVKDICGLFKTGLIMAPKILTSTIRSGPSAGFSEQLSNLINFNHECQYALQNCSELLELFQTQLQN